MIDPVWLGIPTAERWPVDYYPRNVWDLQTFGPFLYIGSGNSSNVWPSPNAGPAPIIRYNGRQFETAFITQDEQVASLRAFGGELYAPGDDAKQNWEYGNLYWFDNTDWRFSRTIPNGIHVFDVFRDGDYLIAVGAARNQELDAWITSSDNGPWRGARLGQGATIFPTGEYERAGDGQAGNGRLCSIFKIGQMLLVSGWVLLRRPNANTFGAATLFRLDDRDTLTPVAGVVENGQTLGPDLFPGYEPRVVFGQVRRPLIWRGRTFYVGALRHNDTQWVPIGVFGATSLSDIKRLTTPSGSQVYDLLVVRDKLYALGNIQLSPRSFEPHLLRLREDGQTFDTVVRFRAPTFARSFEFYNGDWYFGLGSEIAPYSSREEARGIDWNARLSPQTGAILRVSGALVQ